MAIGAGGPLASILAVMTLFTVPIMLLNMFGGIIAGIWLAILGEWWALGYGLALLVVSTFALSFILMPGIFLFGMPGAYLLSRGSVLAYPLVLLSPLYTFAVMTVWCVWVFHLYMQYADARSFLPLLLMVVRNGDRPVDIHGLQGARQHWVDGLRVRGTNRLHRDDRDGDILPAESPRSRERIWSRDAHCSHTSVRRRDRDDGGAESFRLDRHRVPSTDLPGEA